MKKPSGLISTADAAKYIGVSVGTLRAWRHYRKGPPYFRLGDSPRGRAAYRLTDIDAWLNARRVEHLEGEDDALSR